MQNKGEQASRAGEGTAEENSVLVKEQTDGVSTLVGYSFQVKFIQHAQADHPLSLAQFLLG